MKTKIGRCFYKSRDIKDGQQTDRSQKRDMGQTFLTASEGTNLPTPDLKLSVFKTMRQYFSVDEASQAVVLCLCSLSKLT